MSALIDTKVTEEAIAIDLLATSRRCTYPV